MEAKIPVLLVHVLSAGYPDPLGVTEPHAVKDQRVVLVDDQPDQVGVSKPLPERARPVDVYQHDCEDEHEHEKGDRLAQDVSCGEASA